eukprot:XP_011663226.1 PREDICTED: mitogen-activated protein kinase kinase kinase 2-like [Strongylocentrotus purpuratus]
MAAFRRQSHIIEFLVSHGADINLQNLDDHTALHILASTGAKDLSDINDTPTLRKVDSAIIRPYICDLGLAHIKNRNLMSQSAVNIRGTPCFMPPEALGATEPGYRHSNKHDIWSVAGTLVELYSMKRLWGDSVHPVALMARILTGQMGKPESLTAVDSKVQKILEPCFKQKPEERPSASDLLDQFNDLT